MRGSDIDREGREMARTLGVSAVGLERAVTVACPMAVTVLGVVQVDLP